METNRYVHGDYTAGYYKTIITAASFFARNEAAADIFKNCNDRKDMQDVIIIIIIIIKIRYLLGIISILQESVNYSK